jgi:hypothetical protein
LFISEGGGADASFVCGVGAVCFAEAMAKMGQTSLPAVWSLCFLVELQHAAMFFFAA